MDTAISTSGGNTFVSRELEAQTVQDAATIEQLLSGIDQVSNLTVHPQSATIYITAERTLHPGGSYKFLAVVEPVQSESGKYKTYAGIEDRKGTECATLQDAATVVRHAVQEWTGKGFELMYATTHPVHSEYGCFPNWRP